MMGDKFYIKILFVFFSIKEMTYGKGLAYFWYQNRKKNLSVVSVTQQIISQDFLRHVCSVLSIGPRLKHPIPDLHLSF